MDYAVLRPFAIQNLLPSTHHPHLRTLSTYHYVPVQVGWVDGWLLPAAGCIICLVFVFQIRSIHRGSQVAEMRSSVARKLPLEAWGFICPVETPDGAPCGVLNHLASPCTITGLPDGKKTVRPALWDRVQGGIRLGKEGCNAPDVPLAGAGSSTRYLFATHPLDDF